MTQNEKLKETLKCMICHDMATLPVHLKCCENNKGNPGCLLCVRRYLRLNERKKYSRNTKKLSFTGCGCMIDISDAGNLIYRHSKELWGIRDIFGKSVCQHKNCKQTFDTTAELHRHLLGNIKSYDKFEACLEASTKCEECNFFGKRSIVIGEHYKQFHTWHACELCYKCVRVKYLNKHYKFHKKCHEEYGKKLEILHGNIKKMLEY